MTKRLFLSTLFALALVAVFTELPAAASASPEARVRDFIDAFNTRNLDLMAALLDDDVQWLNVDGNKVSIEKEGKQALLEGMKRYFKSCPTCKSELTWIKVAGSRLSAVERATWTGKNGKKAQSSLSVYEFKNGKIARVYYFPAEVE